MTYRTIIHFFLFLILAIASIIPVLNAYTADIRTQYDDGSSIHAQYFDDGSSRIESTDTQGWKRVITTDIDGNQDIMNIPPKTPNNSSSNITGISDEKLRNGDVRMSDIPIAIASITQIIIGLAGTISILMLIYFAVKMQLASGFTGDVSGADSAKKWMFAALIGFVVAVSAWFIMARVIDILSAASGQ